MNRQGRARPGLAIYFVREFARFGVQHVADYDSCAFVDEQFGFGGALTPRPSRNQSHFSFKSIHRHSPIFV